MSWANIWLFIIPFFIAAALPGPAQGTLVANVLARGRTGALAFGAGMVLGNSLWLVAAVFGMASLALRYASLFIAVKWLGVAYLLFVAWQLWRAAPDIGAQPDAKAKGLVSGMLLTLGNPKAVVFFSAILPQAFDLTALSPHDALLLVLLGGAIDASVQAAYVMGALKARRLIATLAHLRLVNRTASIMIGACALLIARR